MIWCNIIDETLGNVTIPSENMLFVN